MRSHAGMDYDFTCAQYSSKLATTIYDLAKTHLVSKPGRTHAEVTPLTPPLTPALQITARQYPDSLAALQYDPSFAVRGVAYDTRRGYLMKLDFLHAVEHGNAFFGRRRLSEAEVVAAYGSSIISSTELSSFRPMVDLFCLPETCLISDVIQHFVDRGMPFHPGYIYSDVKAAVSHLHESGVLHSTIAAQPEAYIEDSPELVRLLRSIRAAGRKVFLLTNSGYKFVATGMDFLTRAQLKPGEWRSLFDLVCVGADKPSFYTETRPFRSLNTATGKVRWVPIDALLPGQVYHGGSLSELNRLSNGDFTGQSVLYLGDSVFSDLSRPSRIGWRTGAILHELEAEVKLQQSEPYRRLLRQLLRCERRMREENARCAEAAAAKGFGVSVGDRELAQLDLLRAERDALRTQLKDMFAPSFGSVFRTHSGATLFMQSILRYSDIYTSHITNLLALSPQHRLFPIRRCLPHEPTLPGV